MKTKWLVKCETKDALAVARREAERRVSLNNIYTDVVVSFPNNVMLKETIDHKMEDYFDSIVLSDKENSFEIQFETKENVKSFWKDLIVHVLSSVKNSAPGISIGAIRNG